LSQGAIIKRRGVKEEGLRGEKGRRKITRPIGVGVVKLK